jgi:hypothetical protein
MKVGGEVYGKRRKFTYKDVLYDSKDWADASKFLPADYDMMIIRVKDKPTITGWCMGSKWEGFRLKDGDEVTQWKRKPE